MTGTRRIAFGAALWGIIALLVMGFAWVSYQNYQNTSAIRETQKSSRSVLDGIEALTTKINDCVDVGGECYEKAQAATGRAVESIGKSAVAAAACADQSGVQGFDEVYACTLDRLAREQPQR